MTYFHSDWAYFGLLAFFLGLFLSIRFWFFKRKIERQTNTIKHELDIYVERISNEENIRYVYDEKHIHYYESGNLKNTKGWEEMKRYFKANDYLVVIFSGIQDFMIIPESMTTAQEFDQFESELLKQAEKLGMRDAK